MAIASVRTSAASARQANDLAQAAAVQARQGGRVVKSTAEAIEKARESSRKIGDIVGLVNEIAFQANLLALNAAVEAAQEQAQGIVEINKAMSQMDQALQGKAALVEQTAAAESLQSPAHDLLDKVDRFQT